MMAARAAEALAAKPQIIEEKHDGKSIKKSAAKRAAEVRNGGLELGRVRVIIGAGSIIDEVKVASVVRSQK